MEKFLDALRDTYYARLSKKSEHDQSKTKQIMKLAMGFNPLGILREPRKFDDTK